MTPTTSFESPSMGRLISFLKYTFIWKTGRSALGTIIFTVVYTLAFVYLINIFYRLALPNPDFITFLCYSIFPLGIFKITLFTLRFKEWSRLVSYFSKVELDALGDSKKYSKITIKFISYVRFIILLFTLAAVGSNIVLVLRLWISNIVFRPQLLKYFNTALPFDENTDVGFYLDLITQTLFMEMGAMYEILWDLLVFGGLVFFIGQFKALKLRCESALDVNDDEVCLKNIVDCHTHYVELMHNTKMFNSLTSPVMFIYLLGITVNLAIAIIGVTSNQDSLAVQLSVIEFVVALMFQLLLLFGLANEITVQSETCTYSVFKSEWVRSSPKVRRAVLLLGTGMCRRMVLTAGPFIDMSLETYVAILRVSYSFYTILNSTS